MSEKKQVPKWEGVLAPARLLTAEEIEELGEPCDVCGATAHVVEVRYSLDDEERQFALTDFPDEDLRFTCGLHAPLDVPEEIFDDIDLAFYTEMRRPVICPEKTWQKYIVTCLKLQPSCLAGCNTIRGRLHVSIEQAHGMVMRGEALYKEKEKSRGPEE